VIVATPDITTFPIDNDTFDFILIGCNFIMLFILIGDGIFDKLTNEEIIE
jgi:serine/threonine protein phosphatase PrpC